MAITKIHAIKSTLGKALAYIENPDKTDGQMLVSGYNCEPQTASIDFEMTAVLAHKARNLKRKRSTNLAYHLIQSFSPEDAVTPEQAHELGKKLAFEYTGGKYEYVVATHIDKGHIHNHIMINAVSFYDYKKLRTVPYRTARQIRDISDRLCMEAHLSVIDDPQKIGQLYPENAGKKKSVSNRTEIRKRLNFCLERATDYSQFLSMAKGLEITPTIRGKHAEACKLNFCRMPIGANDYAMDWYSLDETPGDYALQHFSIDRDKERLIPYIQKAKTYAPDLKLFASPWSPPTWMKNPPVYNWGKLIWEPKNLQAYKLSYYYIEQFSHYVLPGAKRIAATCYTDKLETVSFVNPDGTLAVVLLNRTEQCMPVTLRVKGSLVACEIEASSMTTIVLN